MFHHKSWKSKSKDNAPRKENLSWQVQKCNLMPIKRSKHSVGEMYSFHMMGCQSAHSDAIFSIKSSS